MISAGRSAMPIHDWTLVDAGLFHAFHHGWIEELARALNRGVLPADYFALPEQNIRGPIPDALTLKLGEDAKEPSQSGGGVSVAAGAPPTPPHKPGANPAPPPPHTRLYVLPP